MINSLIFFIPFSIQDPAESSQKSPPTYCSKSCDNQASMWCSNLVSVYNRVLYILTSDTLSYFVVLFSEHLKIGLWCSNMLDPFKQPRNCSKLLRCHHSLIQFQRAMSSKLEHDKGFPSFIHLCLSLGSRKKSETLLQLMKL